MSATSPRRVRARTRDLQALELRLGGATIQQIANELGVSMGGAHLMISRSLAASVETIAERADELRATQLERLEVGVRAIWEPYTAGEAWAIDRMVRLLDRQARLTGIDLRPPDVQVDASQNVIVLPAWGEQPSSVEGEVVDPPTLSASGNGSAGQDHDR